MYVVIQTKRNMSRKRKTNKWMYNEEKYCVSNQQQNCCRNGKATGTYAPNILNRIWKICCCRRFAVVVVVAAVIVSIAIFAIVIFVFFLFAVCCGYSNSAVYVCVCVCVRVCYYCCCCRCEPAAAIIVSSRRYDLYLQRTKRRYMYNHMHTALEYQTKK